MSNQVSASISSEEVVAEGFLRLVSEMLRRPDFLLPLAAGQRQFRDDNYSMASAALLEDLYFDAFGMYLRENHPTLEWARRGGSELWDYRFDGLALSHKETLTGGIAVWWTAGDKQDGRWVPRPEYRTYSSPHPIVLVLANTGTTEWTSDDPAVAVKRRGQQPAMRSGRFLGTLGGLAISGRRDTATKHTLVLAAYDQIGSIVVEDVWAPGQWAPERFHDLWPFLGGPTLNARDLWVDFAYADKHRGLSTAAATARGARLELVDSPLTPGIYVILSSELQDLPMVANNRAHSVEPATAAGLLVQARRAGRYLPFPMWFAHFAASAPPNLYRQQRAQYEELFAAPRRAQP
ncbi:hypothetical protein [Cellulosimicrobium funkei]|uniref:hypothetical protein n=1 Tax=Cellulosimicrobium funkei TaxID=264251 RepID=UPI0037DD0841